MTRYAVTIKLLNPNAKRVYQVYPTRAEAVAIALKALDDDGVLFVKLAVITGTPA